MANTEILKLLAILAHPDDESLGTGGTLAKYAAEGVETHLICATRGERGWQGVPVENPGETNLGKMREQELLQAAEVLSIRDVHFLNYIDGDLDLAPPNEIIPKIATLVQQIRPHVVITFAGDGVYGHPDHIAISQFTSAALVVAASGSNAHQVSKLYHMATSQAVVDSYHQLVGGEIGMLFDGVMRREVVWQDWAITTRLDTSAYWEKVMEAINCHQTQLPSLGNWAGMPREFFQHVFGEETYYRVYSLVNGGRKPETDLFAGLRPEPS